MNVSYYALTGTIEFGPEVTGKQQSAKLLLNSDDSVSQTFYLKRVFFLKDLLNSLYVVKLPVYCIGFKFN